MASGETKEEEKKALGRIMLKRRPAAEVLGRPSAEPKPDAAQARHAELVALSERFGVPALDLLQVCLSTQDLEAVPRALAEEHALLPVLVRPDRLFLAMRDPSQQDVIREVEFVSGKRVYAYAAKGDEIARVLAQAYECKRLGESHYVGPSCPPETLRKAGLLPDATPSLASSAEAPAAPPRASDDVEQAAEPQEPRRVEELPTPAVPELLELGTELEGFVPASALPAQGEDLGEPGLGGEAELPGTVSAYPPRASSLPPALRRHASDGLDDAADAISEIEEAFDGLTDEPSVSCQLPRDESVSGKMPGKNILVVDDSAEVRDLLQRALREEGHNVLLADNGRRALQMIKESRPDLVVLDAMLPEVHGFEIARRLRGSQRYGDMPIVIVSAIYRGWRFAEDLRESCGIEHYVEKPFRMAEVKRAVHSALARGEAAEARSEHEQGESSKLAEQSLKDGVEAFRNGDVAAAIAHLEHGIAIDPLAFRLHFHLGLLYAKSGRTYQAISALERAVEINSRHFAGVKNLAIMYYQAGFRHKAAELWERGLNLAPDEATRSAIKEHLVGLLS